MRVNSGTRSDLLHYCISDMELCILNRKHFRKYSKIAVKPIHSLENDKVCR